MVCNTIEQMRGMAKAGSLKMERQGYRAEMVDDDTYAVSFLRDGERTEYRVTVTDPTFCECAFFVENHPVYGTETVCKHVLFAERQVGIDAYYDALAADWEAGRQGEADLQATADAHRYHPHL